MYRRSLSAALTGFIAVLAVVFCTTAYEAIAAGKEHRLVIDVNENNPQKMNLVLSIVEVVNKEFAAAGDTVKIEVVAYGPGLHMLRADTSPVRQRIGAVQLAAQDLRFAACGTTMAKMGKMSGKEVKLIPEAYQVSAGVVRIMELQDQGYRYLRP